MRSPREAVRTADVVASAVAWLLMIIRVSARIAVLNFFKVKAFDWPYCQRYADREMQV